MSSPNRVCMRAPLPLTPTFLLFCNIFIAVLFFSR